MPTKTKIEWADYVANLLVARYAARPDGLHGKDGYACVKISEGCAHCWASAMNVRLGTGLEYTRPNVEKVTTWSSTPPEERLLSFKLPKGPFKNGRSRPILFLNDMIDMFGEWVDEMDVRRSFRVMEARVDIDFVVLTKRPARMSDFVRDMIPLENVILGTSAENQRRADERIIPMYAISTYGWKTAVSFEPALEAVKWDDWSFLKWLIAGGESGPGARPTSLDAMRSARDFCAANDIPFFFKAWGEFAPVADLVERGMTTFKHRPVEGMVKVGKGLAGHLLDGREWRQVPNG